jgi:Sulfatase
MKSTRSRAPKCGDPRVATSAVRGSAAETGAETSTSASLPRRGSPCRATRCEEASSHGTDRRETKHHPRRCPTMSAGEPRVAELHGRSRGGDDRPAADAQPHDDAHASESRGGLVAAESTLARAESTLARVLKKPGYSTIQIGTWHLGEDDYATPTEPGFDETRNTTLYHLNATAHQHTYPPDRDRGDPGRVRYAKQGGHRAHRRRSHGLRAVTPRPNQPLWRMRTGAAGRSLALVAETPRPANAP